MRSCELDKKNIAIIMAGVMLSVFISALDSTITGTAMPKIVGELKGMELYSWPVTIYLLCSTIAVPIFGKLSDVFGRKSTFLISVLIFIFASILCGISKNMEQLIFFRGIQGIGGGTLIANSFILIADNFPPVERVKYTGMLAAMIGLSSIIGPLAGGVIADSLGWRWLFYINIPFGIASLIIINYSLPKLNRENIKQIIDYAGMFMFIVTLIPMLLAFAWVGKKYDWFSPQILGMLILSLFLLFWFIFIERRAVEPMIPVVLFKSNTAVISIIAVFLVGTVLTGTIMMTPLFLQIVLGISATKSGAIIMPMMVSLIIGSIVSSQIISRTKLYKCIGVVALLIMCLGMLLLMKMNIKISTLNIITNMVIFGLGIGITMPVFDLAAQNAIPQNQIGAITSMIQFSRSMGGMIGSAVLGLIMLESVNKGLSILGLNAKLMNLDALTVMSKEITNDNGLVILPQQIKEIQAGSMQNAFLGAFIVIAAALLIVLFLKEIPLRKSNYEPDKFEMAAE